MISINCKACGETIPPERLEALPETKVCVKCSTEAPYRGFVNMTPRHKGTELSITKDPEAARLMEKYSRR